MLIPTNAPAPYNQLLLLAERDPATAVAMTHENWRHPGPAAPSLQAWSSYTFGWSLLRRYEPSEALVHLEQAQTAFQTLESTEMILHVRRTILLAELAAGIVTNHQTDWDNLVADYLVAGRVMDAVRTQILQIASLNVIGQTQAALKLGNEIAPYVHGYGTADDRARFLRVMGVASKHAGRLSEAQVQIEEAATIFLDLECPVEAAKCSLEQAHIAERQGAFAQAYGHLNTALTIFQDLKIPFQVAVCQKNLGIIASWLGELDQALIMTLRARSTFLQCGQQEQAANCDLSLGNVAFYSGLLDLAAVAYRRAQTTYTMLHLRYQSLLTRRNQAIVLQEQGELSPAYTALCDLEVELDALGDAIGQAEVYQAQAQILRRWQRYDDALERLARAEQQLTLLGRQVGVAECWLERGQIYLNLDNISAAESCLQATLGMCEDQPIYTWRVLHGLGRCAEARGSITTALNHYQTACGIITHLRHTLGNKFASSTIFAQARHLYEDVLRLAVDMQDLGLISDPTLREVQGLDTLSHYFSSTIDTLYSSTGKISESFLRGQGMPDPMIAYVRSLMDAVQPIDYYSCFISYSGHDEALAERLYADLQAKGVRCWLAPHDLTPGDVIVRGIDEAIRLHDKVVLLLSEAAVNSHWVAYEVNLATTREAREGRTVLYPLRLDDAVLSTTQGWAQALRDSRHIGDFRQWTEYTAYQAVFGRLLRDLKAEQR